MRKLKVGEWFAWYGSSPALLVTTSHLDQAGRLKIAVDSDDGFFSTWDYPEYIHNAPRLKRKAWIAFPSAWRVSYDYRFHALYSSNGRKSLIVAGCRAFTIPQAKKHWRSCERYLTADENNKLNKWSLAYVAKLEAHLRRVRAGKAK